MHVYYCMYIYTFHTTLAISWCQTQFKEIYNCNLIINSKRPVTHHKGWPTVVMQLRSNFQSSPRLAKEPRTRSHLRIETQTNRRGKNGANFGWVFFFSSLISILGIDIWTIKYEFHGQLTQKLKFSAQKVHEISKNLYDSKVAWVELEFFFFSHF